ncbi:MAG: adaptor protein MecA [Lachnospirales bacterium]
MKFTKINDTKLKIEVTMDDLQDYNIKFIELAQGNDKIRELIHTLMMKALDEVDFTIDDKPLLIEAVPRSSQSIDIYVTKVDESDEMIEHMGLLDEKIKRLEPDITNKIKEKIKQRNKQKENVDIYETGVLVYSFNDLDNVLSACRQLEDIYKGKSSLYKYEEIYYLYLDYTSNKNIEGTTLSYILNDFGDFTSESIVSYAYLLEHGTTLLKANVIKKLASIVD